MLLYENRIYSKLLKSLMAHLYNSLLQTNKKRFRQQNKFISRR
jgi:hypothetical protein